MLPESQIYHLLLPVAGLSLHAAATHIYVLNLGGNTLKRWYVWLHCTDGGSGPTPPLRAGL